MMMDLLNSETGQWFGWVFLIFTGIASIIYVIYDYFKNPFLYPGIRVPIDLSGKRQPSYVECIDEWINSLDNPRQDIKDMYNNALERWENECLALISKTILWRSHKRKIYQGMRENAFRKDKGEGR